MQIQMVPLSAYIVNQNFTYLNGFVAPIDLCTRPTFTCEYGFVWERFSIGQRTGGKIYTWMMATQYSSLYFHVWYKLSATYIVNVHSGGLCNHSDGSSSEPSRRKGKNISEH